MMLHIVRHAWAVDPGDPDAPTDFERPLTKEGRKRFASVVQRLVERGFAPEVIATSPLVRCRQTAEILAEEAGGSPEIVELDALAPESDLAKLVAWTNREAAGFRQVAWVGHAPDVGQLTAALIGDARAAIHFGKGAVAAVEFDGPVQAARGELQWLASAKMLGC